MARDMSVKVRIEAFLALGKVQLVAENVLLQSLSKKVLGNRSGSKTITKCSVNESKFSLSAAGAFMHGIEDEFYEVMVESMMSKKEKNPFGFPDNHDK